MKTLCAACLLLVCSGCSRSVVAPEILPVPHVGQVVIVNGFTGEGNANVDWRGVRVGKYFDFSPYDSLVVTFSAELPAGGEGPVSLSLKVGPGFYAFGSLTAPKADFSFQVPVPALSKARFAALVFFVSDTASTLVLSNLRVTGWYTY